MDDFNPLVPLSTVTRRIRLRNTIKRTIRESARKDESRQPPPALFPDSRQLPPAPSSRGEEGRRDLWTVWEAVSIEGKAEQGACLLH